MTIDDVREIALSFPGVQEHTTFDSPSFKVGKRFLASAAKIDSDSLCLKMPDQFEREFWISTKPEAFYNQEHYENFDAILIRMSVMEPDLLRDLFEQTWRTYAPKKYIAQYEENA